MVEERETGKSDEHSAVEWRININILKNFENNRKKKNENFDFVLIYLGLFFMIMAT